MSLLEVRNISLSYDDATVIENISFNVEKGEVVCILGESGCGKTSILKAIRGFMNRNSGEIYYPKLNESNLISFAHFLKNLF